MATLLHVTVSPREEASHSRRIGRVLIESLGAAGLGIRVVERDLARLPPPHLDKNFVEASLMPQTERRPAHVEALAFSETLIGELEAAAIIVISTPMHNFTVPSALKGWIDHVVRPHRTFQSTTKGKVGLLRNRPILVVVACGGSFNDDPFGQIDFLTPYLRYVFGIIGISNVEVLRLERLNQGAAQIEQTLNFALDWIEKHISPFRLLTGTD